jgi:hypothetical protein
MTLRLSRRTLALGLAASSLPASRLLAQEAAWSWVYPIGKPGAVPGDGFYLRHGYATENTSFYPGGWHTGENYYALEGETAGAEVYAVADGEIVFAGFDYPGPVVIVRHADDLYSMYGHLDYDLAVDSGPVTRGQLLGTVLFRTDGRSPSHLHFEVRRFLTTPEVNGPAPRYGFTCGPNCAPGPGYWPIDAPEHPAGMGWLNPLHAIASQSLPPDAPIPPGSVEVVVAEGARPEVDVFAVPDAPVPEAALTLTPGDRFPLVGVDVGEADSTGTSAEAYRLWYQIAPPNASSPVWVRALEPSQDATGSDGRSSSLRFTLLPWIPDLRG